jgi:trans-aconitate 2-methyltransferase
VSRAYAFGDGEPAATRLAVLAAVFEPPSRALLAELAATRTAAETDTVVDLGCGPGFTTRLLAEVFAPARVLGLDQSARFLSAAAARRLPRSGYARADVAAPLPIVAAEVMYARFLLSHLPDPEHVVDRWAERLTAGGVLVLEETERIVTADPSFSAYLRLVTDLVATRGATLLPGPRLAAMPLPRHTSRVANRIARLDARTDQAARMFRLNLESWRGDPVLAGRQAELDALSEGLGRHAADTGTDLISWQLRQVVLAAGRSGAERH